MTQDQITAIRYTEEGWGQGKTEVIDEIVSPDGIDHHPLAGFEANREGVKKSIQALHAAFPDLSFKVTHTITEGDKVATRWVFNGTQEHPFGTIPASNAKVTTTGIMLFRLENGKIKEWWHEYDLMSFMQQIGAIPK